MFYTNEQLREKLEYQTEKQDTKHKEKLERRKEKKVQKARDRAAAEAPRNPSFSQLSSLQLTGDVLLRPIRNRH
jgi:hypothetical protein